MLFVCYVTIDPKNRDESFRRLKAHGIPTLPGVKLLGAWISLALTGDLVDFRSR
jgi:Domain of unknown function (DUF3303)